MVFSNRALLVVIRDGIQIFLHFFEEFDHNFQLEWIFP